MPPVGMRGVRKPAVDEGVRGQEVAELVVRHRTRRFEANGNQCRRQKGAHAQQEGGRGAVLRGIVNSEGRVFQRPVEGAGKNRYDIADRNNGAGRVPEGGTGPFQNAVQGSEQGGGGPQGERLKGARKGPPPPFPKPQQAEDGEKRKKCNGPEREKGREIAHGSCEEYQKDYSNNLGA